ncbi:tetratricopeptide repeat protein [Sandarakinorhabdus sp. AAP62]|uniref:tetratricopeptide repeat protein n=1 Tax=Sandarakinorhabdus sp. AAP62 TaxID=1248916 RepID=UPI0002F62D3E|nr:tetratricopeptide repeat protein [Sandarakinorhabdus sp. AAP62]
MRIRLPIAALLALSAPAHAAKPAALASDSALHAYVIGRYAELDRQVGLAARLMEEARAADPTAGNVKRRSWELALANGDQARAFQLARSLAASGAADPDVTITRIAEAVIRKDWALAASLRQKLGGQGWPIVAGPVIDAWAAQARGDAGAALNLLDPQRHQGFLRGYIAEQRAHLLASLGRWDEAATAYRQARSGGGPALLFLRQGQADALLMAGKREEALAVLFPADKPTAVARERLQAGKRLGPLAAEPRQALAWMSARLAVDLARERSEPMALMFARLASFMAPEMPISWLTLGDMLGRANQPQPALAALDKVPAGLGLEEAVRARRAEVLEGAGQAAAAGQLLQRAADAPGASSDDWAGLAGWHQRGGRFAQAATAYGTALDRFGKAMGASAWNLHYLRGMMRDRAGDWPGAQADFRAALALFPDEPGVLNYLGYGLLERGGAPAEARAMIEKAAQLRPGDGGIIDSLGWVQLQTGETEKAVITLERAVSLEPQDPTIIGHLGDALWQQGRRIEARFRWREALALDAPAEDKRKLQARLDYGLEAAPAMLALK